MKLRSKSAFLIGVVLLSTLILVVRWATEQQQRINVIIREAPTDRELRRLGALTFDDSLEGKARTGHITCVMFDRTADLDRGIPLLGRLPKIESVAFSGHNTTDAHVRMLARLARENGLQIQSLRFLECSITNTGLAVLKQFSQLSLLDIPHAEISNDGLKHIATLSGLRDLTLDSTPITDEGLAIVASLSELRGLSLDHTNITDEGLKHLRRLQHLEYLNLSFTHVTDRGVVYLKQFQAIKSLGLWGTAISEAGVTELLDSLPNLKAE